MRCLRKSMLSPCNKQVVQLPSHSVASGRGKLTPTRQIETRSLTSPRTEGLALRTKQPLHRESTSKTRSSPRRSTPSKRVTVVRTGTSTSVRKTKHVNANDRKKGGLTPRRTPSKRRTPRKSAKRTPAKSMFHILRIRFCHANVWCTMH